MTLADPLPEQDVNLMKRLEVTEYLSQKPIKIESQPPFTAQHKHEDSNSTVDRTDARILSELFPDRTLIT